MRFRGRNKIGSARIAGCSGDINLGTIQRSPFYLTTGSCARGTMREQMPTWDREEIIVCMVLAFCIGNALITLIYRIA
jgi:hypothetical protein